ncbi:2839_t:CDS:2 [Cetraspora pellucida]|uniref:2839_t:CDS:1 n=1 Tax=Cetraspora pellucida TaxID=1433469 RepID=A0A9N9NGR1_9GLOM|nr:2839_t:CDS:2 [Cetraspora pellucida]
MADYFEREALRKRKSRENETPEQREKRRACDRENKSKKMANETAEQRRAQAVDERPNEYQEMFVLESLRCSCLMSLIQTNNNRMPSSSLPEYDRELLQKF